MNILLQFGGQAGSSAAGTGAGARAVEVALDGTEKTAAIVGAGVILECREVEMRKGVLQGIGDGHLGHESELGHDLGVVGDFLVVPDHGPGDGVQGQVAGAEEAGLGLEDLAQIRQDGGEVEDTGNRGHVVAGLEGQILDRGVADDEVARLDVEDDVADLDGENGRVGQGEVADQVGAVCARREQKGGI